MLPVEQRRLSVHCGQIPLGDRKACHGSAIHIDDVDYVVTAGGNGQPPDTENVLIQSQIPNQKSVVMAIWVYARNRVHRYAALQYGYSL